MPARSDERSPRLVFLHGFTQTHHHWHRCAHLVAEALGQPTLAFVDLPGHGLSADDRLAIDDAGGPLADLAGPGTYVGYSMGGRFALVAAAEGHPAVERLVLIGSTPGIDDPVERSSRRTADHRLADRLGRIGVDAFLDEWLAGPLFSSLPVDRRGLDHRRRNTPAGLAHGLVGCGTGSMTSLWPRLPSIDVPVLVLAGERDAKFSEIGRRVAAHVPRGTFATIADTGHAAHAERPDLTAAILAEWLAATEGQPSASPTENKSP